MRRRRRKAWVAAAAVLAVGVAGFLLLWIFRPEPPRTPPPPQVPEVAVVPAALRSGALVVVGNGTVRPTAEVVLSPQVSGRVVGISPSLVSGGRFRAGEPLLQIDPADFRNAVEVARAEVTQRRAEVLRAAQEASVARLEYERLQRLEGIEAPAGGTPELGSLAFREPQLAAARAAMERAEAQLRNAALSLERTRVTAPFDGMVLSESVDRGQIVSPGQPLARIFASEAMEVVVPLSSAEAELIPNLWARRPAGDRVAIPATVYADFGGRRFAWSGYVDRAVPALDSLTRTVSVVVRVPRPFAGGAPVPAAPGAVAAGAGSPPLLVGLYTTVEIEGVALDRYFVLPRAALRDGGTVWVVRGGTLSVVPVTVIQEVEGEVYLQASLEAGDPVVVSDLPVVAEGMRVRVVVGPVPGGEP